MSSLSQKFYGLGEPEGDEARIERFKKAYESKRFGVTYSAVKYFLSENSANQFYNNIESGAKLVKKDPKTGQVETKKSK